MITFLLTLFVTVITPIPWWLMLFHLLIQKDFKKLAYVVYFGIILVWVILGYIMFGHQDFLFSNHFTPNFVTRILGITLIVMAAIVDWQVMKTLGLKRLAMWPEFKGENRLEHFVVKGVYRYARHPRYVEYMLVSLSAGFFFGYAFLFYFFVYLVISFWLVAIVEESELVDRFGGAYQEYQKKVPRFFIF